MAEISIIVAVAAGLASFVAPCILPVIPAFLAYISGTTISGLSDKATVQISRSSVILNTIFFVTGFSVVFSILGVIINTVLSDIAGDLIGTLNQIGGIIIISFGVYMILSIKIAKLNMEKKFIPKMSKASYPTSFLFGLAFAAGWTPCVGPVLGTILTLAATTPSTAFHLLLAYSVGLGIPFILMGIFISRATGLVRKLSKHLKYYNILLGGFIIILGILVFTNQLASIASFGFLNDLVLLG